MNVDGFGNVDKYEERKYLRHKSRMQKFFDSVKSRPLGTGVVL